MTDEVEARLAASLRMTEALLEGMDAAVRVSDPNDVWRFASYLEYMRKYNQVLDAAMSIEPIDAPVDKYNIDKVPSKFDTIAMQQQGYFESVRGELAVPACIPRQPRPAAVGAGIRDRRLLAGEPSARRVARSRT